MSTYYQIKGQNIQDLSTEPVNLAAGQVWYNNSTDTLNIYKTFTDAWITAGSLNTERTAIQGAGTQTAGLAIAGENTPSYAATGTTEEYNGASWTTTTNLNVPRTLHGGAGTQTAAVAFGGYNTANKNETEEYDGNSWAASNAMGTTRRAHGGAGTQTSALGFGGFTTAISNATEEYDGNSWAAGGNLTTQRYWIGAAGTQTAGLAFGGSQPPRSNHTEEYNGTSWTNGGNLNQARQLLAGSGTQTAALAFGGESPPTGTPPGTNTFRGVGEKYDGTSWTNTSTMNTPRQHLGGTGTQTAALAMGGWGGGTPNFTTIVEEFTNESVAAAVKVT